ncbi:Plant invertase/pectin methylesterase inhibitor superfamily protein [Arabidopsis thaliana]|nr:Plant invertase/pectin methylesterase inhibitor superfamily protein [Arabidopsis thaliana]ABE65762.1 invertase/pectin methylesterase inhibitor family protein [Arabidopsis thaliana]ABF83650.1 At1g70720 [Arabidopsis thaliana]AEE35104.1 Plant invertase/pectin methylesterase inhibitor superfamily protein [Arabidopsis thaliana]|eukprot:NP_564998.1 Plant invertase/pectin methylesterase inhibitor superfamily protein [Arabidopsis thaliana]
MVTMMRPTLLILLFSTFLPQILTVDPPLLPSNGSDFIRLACNTTLYPDLCFSTLSSFANSIQNDSNRLARVAISLTLHNTLHLLSYLQNAYNRDHPTPVLRDCFENLKDAVDGMRGSMKQMKELVSASGSIESFRFQMSNVKTWLSAALTDEYTCTDGFKDVHEDDSIKDDVCSRVDDVKKLTSNALALVNRYADESIIN